MERGTLVVHLRADESFARGTNLRLKNTSYLSKEEWLYIAESMR